METNNMQNQINDINAKLDIILEEIDLQKRKRRQFEDLQDDLMRVGKDVYQTAVLEFEELHDHINTGDMMHLGKKLLRNVNNITKTFEQLESVKDFIHDFSPISRELAIDFMDKLDEFDRKGYFAFMKELGNVADNIVTSFSAEDVKMLGENVVSILNTVKNLTQPEMLQAVNNALSVYKNLDIEVEKEVSLISLVKELRTPEMKRGLAFAVQFLKSLADQNENKTINK